MYEEEEQVILDNLQTFPIAEWKGLSMLTEHQRDMMRQPFSWFVSFFAGIKMNGSSGTVGTELSAPESLHLALSVWRAAVSVSRAPERSPVDENDRCGKIPPAVGCI